MKSSRFLIIALYYELLVSLL